MLKTVAAGVSAGAVAAIIAGGSGSSNEAWVVAAGSVAAVAAAVFTRSTFLMTLGVAVVGGSVAGVVASYFDRDGTFVERVGKGVVFGAAMGLGCTAMISTAYGVIKVFSYWAEWLATQQVIGWMYVDGKIVPIFMSRPHSFENSMNL